jgi:hypothetical protein
MKCTPLAAAAIFLAANFSAQADVVIVQKVEGAGGQNGEMIMKIKDGKSRTDVNPQMSMITDTKSGEVITLMHDQKSYMKISGDTTRAMLDRIRKMTDDSSASATPKPAPKLKATGRKDKINGYDTEEYTCDVNGKKITYWIAKNYPDYSAILAEMMKMQQNSLASMMKGMMPEASEFPGMPIRTEVENGSDKITTTLISAKQEPVNAADMEVPAAYKEMTMPNFNVPGK